MCASPSAIVIAVALVKNPLISDLFHHILVQSSGIYWFRGSTILWIWFHVDLESTLCGFDWISIISIPTSAAAILIGSGLKRSDRGT